MRGYNKDIQVRQAMGNKEIKEKGQKLNRNKEEERHLRRMGSREMGKDKEYHCHVKTGNRTEIDDAITGCHLVIGIKCWTETSANLRIKPSHTFHPFFSFLCLPFCVPLPVLFFLTLCYSAS